MTNRNTTYRATVTGPINSRSAYLGALGRAYAIASRIAIRDGARADILTTSHVDAMTEAQRLATGFGVTVTVTTEAR